MNSLDQLPTYLSADEARILYAQGDDAAHDFDHVSHVTRMAERIAQAEGADVTVVRLAALLHDVSPPAAADPAEQADATATRRIHHLAAADFARQLLAERGLGTERIANVVHCIAAHRFRNQTVRPQTLEAQCLYDADKLDSIGALGVARAFAYAGRFGSRLWSEPWPAAPPDQAKPSGADYTPVHEFVYKLQRILATLYTPTARAIGAQRHAVMLAFYEQLDAEAQGYL